MALLENEHAKILHILKKHENLFTDDFKNRLKIAIKTLYFGYIEGAAKELNKTDKTFENLFDTLLYTYNKRQKAHQDKLAFLHCFEIALRSTLAVEISAVFGENDDWFKEEKDGFYTENLAEKRAKILKIKTTNSKRFGGCSVEIQNTFDIFDLFTFGDLITIVEIFWQDLKRIFASEKSFKGQILATYGTRKQLTDKLNQIRHFRNEVYHNKKSNVKLPKDAEILLLRLGYNPKNGLNLSENSLIKLKFDYE